MKKLWQKITKEDVIKAVEMFKSRKENYPEPRNTFLVINDKKYPFRGRGLYSLSNCRICIKTLFWSYPLPKIFKS